eukprot:3496696-Rhodomonas_salina.3
MVWLRSRGSEPSSQTQRGWHCKTRVWYTQISPASASDPGGVRNSRQCAIPNNSLSEHPAPAR